MTFDSRFPSSLAIGSLLVASCAGRSTAFVSVPPAATRRSGCYVLTWQPPPPGWLRGLDSVRLAATTSLDSSKSHCRHVPYATTKRYDQGYFGPFWELRGDSLQIYDGLLSGWELLATSSASGFAGRATTFTDVISSDPPLVWTVTARKVACTGP